MEKNKIGQLCYWLVRQKEGKELLDELRIGLQNDPVLPRHPDFLAQFGGADNYSSFRAGMSHFIKVIELHAKGYIDQENAMQAAANKKEQTKTRKGVKR